MDLRFFGIAREVPHRELPVFGPDPLCIYWHNPASGDGFAGAGVAACIKSESPHRAIEEARAAAVEWLGVRPDVPGPWFGGFAFDGERASDPEWAGFGPATFRLAEYGIAVRGGRAFAVSFCRAMSAEDAEGVLQRGLGAALSWAAAPALPGAQPPASGDFVLEEDPSGWDALVQRALVEIDSGRMEKIVAARRVRVAFRTPPDVSRILAALVLSEPSSTTFLLRGNDGAAFLGATPETLVQGRGARVQADAMAGTLPRDAAGASVWDDKLLREHQVVVDEIVRALAALPARVDAAAVPQVRSLRHVLHLHTPIKAELGGAHTLPDAAVALHPTPAVAGAPRQDALAFLRSHEGFDRGWYAGAVGAVGHDSLHLCVALRSALVHQRHAWAYAGAGLVRGSEPESEWEETARKLRTILSAFGAAA